MLKAAIYDMDGLMVDSERIQYQSTELMLQHYRHSLDELPHVVVLNSLGRRVSDILSDYRAILGISATVEEMHSMRENIFMEGVRKELTLMPGLEDSIKILQNTDFRIGLATSATPEYLDYVLDHFHLRNHFYIIVSSNDVTKGKPDPEIYLLACKRLGIPPQNVIVFEDAPNGIEAAKGAGCVCFAVRGNHTAALDYSRADRALESLTDLRKEMLLKY
jgi:HAD superfamily hydrolase (TIGR01509 family)